MGVPVTLSGRLTRAGLLIVAAAGAASVAAGCGSQVATTTSATQPASPRTASPGGIIIPGGPVFRESSSSSTDCDPPRHARELPALHHLSQLFGNADSVLSAGLGQQNAEFLAAIPANHVNFPQLLME